MSRAPAMDLNGIDARFKMGKAADGESAGLIWLHAALPGAALATPAGLTFNVHRDDVTVILDEQDALRQILAPEALADIVVEDDYAYRIDFYTAADAGELVNGLYEPTGDPFVTWLIENPDGASANNRLVITRMVESVAQLIFTYTYSAGNGSWTLTTSDGTNTLRKETVQWVDNERRYVVVDGNEQEVQRIHETHTTYGFGTVMTAQSVDPNGANLVTTWEYYTSGAGKTGKVRSASNTDGSWTFYDYDELGRTTQVVSSWKDVNLPGSPTLNSARSIEYDYAAVDEEDLPSSTSYQYYPRTVIERILGREVGRTYYAYIRAPDEPLIKIESRASVPEAAYGDAGDTLTTRTTYVLDDNEKPELIEYPDGRVDAFFYYEGEFTRDTQNPGNSSFTPGQGSDCQVIVIHRGDGDGNGAAQFRVQERSVTTLTGQPLMQESYVCTSEVCGGTSTGWERIDWSVHALDERGRTTDVWRADGAHVEMVWGCCSQEYVIDATGIRTDYVHDALGRVILATRIGVDANTNEGYAEQPDLDTVYEYDPLGRLLSTSVDPEGLNLTTASVYDLAGRLTSTTDESGLVTTYDYDTTAEGGRRVTITQPGGATQISAYYRDGRIRSVTGTGIVAQYYDYGVNDAPDEGDGTQWRDTRTADDESPRFQRSHTDMLGRVVAQERPAYPSGTLTSASEYDAAGRLVRNSAPGRADTLYEYDAMSRVVRSGLDCNTNGTLDLASTDRIQENVETCAEVNGEWWRVQTSKTYATIDSGTATTTGVQRQRLTGLGGSVTGGILTAESQSLDIHG
ncbi:MAG: RHS repeat protein, partial [Phycisphaerae bacterium]|nr:RHS repeat protein [Phycisphaerae bacterium]